jgi:hypothetical protein
MAKENQSKLKVVQGGAKEDPNLSSDAKIERTLNAQGKKSVIAPEVHAALGDWWDSKGKAAMPPEMKARYDSAIAAKDNRKQIKIIKEEGDIDMNKGEIDPIIDHINNKNTAALQQAHEMGLITDAHHKLYKETHKKAMPVTGSAPKPRTNAEKDANVKAYFDQRNASAGAPVQKFESNFKKAVLAKCENPELQEFVKDMPESEFNQLVKSVVDSKKKKKIKKGEGFALDKPPTATPTANSSAQEGIRVYGDSSSDDLSKPLQAVPPVNVMGQY